MSTATNIKSKKVRKDTVAALKSALYILRSYKSNKSPSSGLVLCAGNANFKKWYV